MYLIYNDSSMPYALWEATTFGYGGLAYTEQAQSAIKNITDMSIRLKIGVMKNEHDKRTD